MSNPLYSIGEIVYFKESAAIGHIEPVSISGIHRITNTWLYSVNSSSFNQQVGAYGDRRSAIHMATMYFTEDEFVTQCDAFALATANAKLIYEKLALQYASLCPGTE